MAPKLEQVGKIISVLGESPHWIEETQSVIYVDIIGQNIISVDAKTEQESAVHIDLPDVGAKPDNNWRSTVGFVVPVKGHADKYVTTTGRSLDLLTWGGHGSPHQLTRLHTVDPDKPYNRFNDGKCDPRGRLWAGTMGREPVIGQPEKERGSLYCMDNDRSLRTALTDVNISNGMCWTPDSSIMYYIDSMRYCIDAYDFNVTNGTIANRRPVYEYKPNGQKGIPDGMTIDTAGNLWIANFLGETLICVDPRRGQKIQTIDFPCSDVSACVFGGPNYDVMYVTTAQLGVAPEKLKKEPLAGALFKVTNLGAKGYPSVPVDVDLRGLMPGY